MAKCRDCGVSTAFLSDRCDDCFQKREARLSQQPRDLSVESVDWKLVLKYVAAILIVSLLASFVIALVRPVGNAVDFAALIILLIGLTAAAAQVKIERSRHVLVIAIIMWFLNGLPVLVSAGFISFWHYVPYIGMYVLLGLVATVLSFAIVRPEKT